MSRSSQDADKAMANDLTPARRPHVSGCSVCQGGPVGASWLSVLSTSAKVSPAWATGTTCHSVHGFQPQHDSCPAARSVLCAWCPTGLVSLPPLLQPLAVEWCCVQGTHIHWASSHTSWGLFAPQTLILRMAISGLITSA